MTFAGFPAELEFSADNRRTLVVQRVYDRAKLEFDFREVRDAKAWAWGESLEVFRGDVSAAWNWLVKQGYLVEYKRGERGVRRFTLAWSRNPDRRHVGNPNTYAT